VADFLGVRVRSVLSFGPFVSGSVGPPAPVPPPAVYDVPGSYTVTIPARARSARVQLWGSGGGGGGGITTTNSAGGGGAGGYAESTIAVTPGAEITLSVAEGGPGGSADEPGFSGDITDWDGGTITGGIGQAGESATNGGTGGAGCPLEGSVGDITHSGGNGANRTSASVGGGGGGSPGPAANGNNAAGATGGAAVAGGAAGGNSSATPTPGGYPGAGGGGACNDATPIGASGANGKAIITWSTEEV
jgi:hypothetical protein